MLKKLAYLSVILFLAVGAAMLFAPWREYRIETKTASGKETKHIALLPLLQAAIANPADAEFNEPLNILLAGVPGKGNPAPNLTDTIMVAHLDPHAKKITLFSLPRDLIVQAPDAPYYTRLNGLYERGGITSLRLKVEDITGLAITRYAIVDLAAVREVVDVLGGINMYVEHKIYDPRFPGKEFDYETFELEPGWRFLDGLTATRYIRTRNDREGDFGRMRRQQQLIAALRQKITGLSLVWDLPKFLKILDSLNIHVQTNIATRDLLSLFAWGKNLSDDHIVIAPLDADREKQLFTTGDFWFGEERASIVKPIEGTEMYDTVKAYVQDVLLDNN